MLSQDGFVRIEGGGLGQQTVSGSGGGIAAAEGLWLGALGCRGLRCLLWIDLSSLLYVINVMFFFEETSEVNL